MACFFSFQRIFVLKSSLPASITGMRNESTHWEWISIYECARQLSGSFCSVIKPYGVLWNTVTIISLYMVNWTLYRLYGLILSKYANFKFHRQQVITNLFQYNPALFNLYICSSSASGLMDPWIVALSCISTIFDHALRVLCFKSKFLLCCDIYAPIVWFYVWQWEKWKCTRVSITFDKIAHRLLICVSLRVRCWFN